MGLIGGVFLGIAAFFLVFMKFDSRIWVGGLSAIAVFGLCAVTGIFGCLFAALVIGALFKADL